MRALLPLLSVLVLLGGCAAPATSQRTVAPPGTRLTQPLDAQWRFTVADPAGAEKPDFDDSSWRTVDLPHDWSIQGPFAEANPTGGAGGFLPSGVAWYRKSIALPEAHRARKIFVEFDGIMENSDVWVNGVHLGHRPNGYVSLRYDITAHVRFGGRNVLAVRADTSKQPASRWYSGAGIYRHVRLVTLSPIHIEPASTFVTTESSGPSAPAAHRIRISTQVRNESGASRESRLHVSILNAAGDTVADAESKPQSIAAGQRVPVSVDVVVKDATLWNIDSPALYGAAVSVRTEQGVEDEERVTLGIREARFDRENGFVLNGRPVKLLGVCLHHDGGAFGAAVPRAVWEQRLRTLRSIGVNAIRTAHNPPDPAFLDLCDRMGFLVMDELFDCWTVGKNPHDYHLYFTEWWRPDLRDTVLRDRNHPSVILYSAGNEIHDTPKEELAKGILRTLVAAFHEYDPTRPVTQALFRPNVSHDYTNGLADMLDVIGTNYRDQELLAAWRAQPGRKIVGTEQQHNRETWLAARDNPQHAGQFLWTGIDYLGESRAWPVIGHPSGLLDRTGAIKPLGRQRQSWWSDTPMVALVRRTAPTFVSNYDPGYEPANTPALPRQVLFADWTPASLEPHDETVEVYSNCETVEVFLNDRSLGSKGLNADASPRIWKVPFAPGVLRAIARNRGADVARDELRTAGKPARVVLTTDAPAVSTDWEDVVRVTATIVDANGAIVPNATQRVDFRISGPGTVVAVDNGDISSREPFQGSTRHAYQGSCVAFVRATASRGTIRVEAAAEGLAPGSVSLSAVERRR